MQEVSGTALMKNLEGQVKEFGEWQDILNSLSSKAICVRASRNAGFSSSTPFLIPVTICLLVSSHPAS